MTAGEQVQRRLPVRCAHQFIGQGLQQGAQHLDVQVIVFGHQNAQRLGARPLGGRAACLLLLRRAGTLCGDLQGEGRAFARHRRHRERTPQQACQFLRNAQPQPGAAIAPRNRPVRLLEGLEQPLQLVRGNADAGIADRDAHIRHVIGLLRGLRLDGDAAGFGELDGIGQQVEEDLPQAGLVRADPLRHGLVNMQIQRESLVAGARGPHLPGLLQQGAQVKIDEFGGELPGLDLRQVEHVIEDRHQGFTPGRKGVHLLAGVPRQVHGVQHLGRPQDRVHRRAQFMAHHGEKLGFRPVGGIGLFARLLGALDERVFLDRIGSHLRRRMGNGPGLEALGLHLRQLHVQIAPGQFAHHPLQGTHRPGDGLADQERQKRRQRCRQQYDRDGPAGGGAALFLQAGNEHPRLVDGETVDPVDGIVQNVLGVPAFAAQIVQDRFILVLLQGLENTLVQADPVQIGEGGVPGGARFAQITLLDQQEVGLHQPVMPGLIGAVLADRLGGTGFHGRLQVFAQARNPVLDVQHRRADVQRMILDLLADDDGLVEMIESGPAEPAHERDHDEVDQEDPFQDRAAVKPAQNHAQTLAQAILPSQR